MLNKEIRPCSEQTRSHLAAVICLWVPAALRQPRAGASTLLQPPAWCELLAWLQPAENKASKDQRCSRNCADTVAFSWSPEAQKGSHFARLWYEAGRLTREAGEGDCGHRWACGWHWVLQSFLNLAPHSEFSFEQFSELEICLSLEPFFFLCLRVSSSRVEKTLTYSLETSF